MKCIIVGVGKVGYSLVANLCAAGHEVTVIDSSRRRLDIMEEHFNISVVEGDAAKLDVLREADIEHADLLVAVTEKDELNMVACFVAKNAGAAATIARVRNPGYSDFDDRSRMDALGIDMLINPEKVSADEIARLLDHPEAHYVGYFGSGQVQLLELPLNENCSCLDQPLYTLDLPAPSMIVAIDRGGELIIPKGNDSLQAGDDILVVAYTQDMKRIEEFLGISLPRPKNIAIFGASLSGFYLAEQLEQRERPFHVKLLEPDLSRCEEMAQNLHRTVIIHGEGSDINLYEEENIGDTDVFVAASEDDKENLFACVLARNLGAKKTISQIRGSDYAAIIESVGVDRAVSLTRLTADAILRFIDRKRILSLTRFDDSSGQIAEYVVEEGARCIGVPIMKLGFPRKALICMITRGEKHLIARGGDCLQPGDTVMVFSMPEALAAVEKLLTVGGAVQ